MICTGRMVVRRQHTPHAAQGNNQVRQEEASLAYFGHYQKMNPSKYHIPLAEEM